jgi:hypothetical protein
VQPPRELALRGAGRAEKEDVLARERREQQQPRLGAALDEAGTDAVDRGAQRGGVRVSASASGLGRRAGCGALLRLRARERLAALRVRACGASPLPGPQAIARLGRADHMSGGPPTELMPPC